MLRYLGKSWVKLLKIKLTLRKLLFIKLERICKLFTKLKCYEIIAT